MYKVSPYDLTQIVLNESDTVSSVLQNIAIILSTWQGSVPLYRNFGLPGNFVDKPIPVAKTLIVAEVQEAIRIFEPRAKIINITSEIDVNNPGKLIPIVEVEIINE